MSIAALPTRSEPVSPPGMIAWNLLSLTARKARGSEDGGDNRGVFAGIVRLPSPDINVSIRAQTLSERPLSLVDHDETRVLFSCGMI
jgi:hypothetical protein